MGNVQAKNRMQEMKLVGMLAHYDEKIALGQKESWSFTEVVDSLVQAEYEYREVTGIERRVKNARFPTGSHMEDFDYTVPRSVTRQEIKELLNLKWIDQGRPLILVGQTGIGKSFLAEALGRYACRNKKTTLFLDITQFIELTGQARASGGYLKFRAKLAKPDVLIIDDFGARKLNSTESQDLKELLEGRCVSKSTIITTQLPLDHWSEVISDTVLLDAITDLLDHSAVKLMFKGGSYRKVKAKKLDENQDKK